MSDGTPWIDVRDRLPDDSRFVLAWDTASSLREYEIAMYCGDDYGWVVPGMSPTPVTHWCELPKPPLSP